MRSKDLEGALYISILYINIYMHVFGGMILSKWMYLHFETLCLWPSSERISHCLADPILPSFKWKPASDTAKGDVMKIEISALWLRDWKSMAFTRPRYSSPRTAQTSFTRCRPWSGAAIRSMKGEMPTPPATSSSARSSCKGPVLLQMALPYGPSIPSLTVSPDVAKLHSDLDQSPTPFSKIYARSPWKMVEYGCHWSPEMVFSRR